jgi:hypothetical protein
VTVFAKSALAFQDMRPAQNRIAAVLPRITVKG